MRPPGAADHLQEIVNAVMACPTLLELFEKLTDTLGDVLPLDGLALLLLDEATQTVTLEQAYSRTGVESPRSRSWPLAESPAGGAITQQQLVHVPFVQHETRFTPVTALLKAQGVRAICYVPLTTASRRIGALAVATLSADRFSEDDLALASVLGKPVALAVENARTRESLARERNHLQLMLGLSHALAGAQDLSMVSREASHCLQPLVPHDILGLTLWDADSQRLRVRAVHERDSSTSVPIDLEVPLEGSASGRAFTTGLPQTLLDAELAALWAALGLPGPPTRSACSVPLRTARANLGALSLASRSPNAFENGALALLGGLAGQISIAVEGALMLDQVHTLNRRLTTEKLYLEEELRVHTSFADIIGNSRAIRTVLQQVERVAATESTVLILGETGTGKELIARALHECSLRRQATFVKLNCAAIPTGLLESELFGHERGAFTGAISTRTGRFELAHRGTLFLDEIAEIPLDLQPKLLRVLQEKEFERLGSSRTLRSDARLIAATNRDLKTMIAEGRFRSDLYYRLNVFPIVLPALRDRREDIPALVAHFTRDLNRRLRRHITTIPRQTMDLLVRYPWPGNVRELQNVVERSVLLSAGDTLDVAPHELDSQAVGAPAEATALEHIERDAIARAVRECGGMIGGPRGAAARLGLKRTTLISRMRKLGISVKVMS